MRRTILNGTAGLLAATLTFGVAFPAGATHLAPAGESSEAAAYDEEAKAKFAEGDYEGAAESFEKAFDASGDANYLFNIGRVYEEAGNIAKAVEFYDRFVTSKNVALEDRKLAVERLEVLRPILKAQQEDEAPDEEEETAAPAPEPEPTEPAEPEGPTKRQRTLRIAGFATLGVGVAALATGGALGAVASSRDGAIQDEDTIRDRREAADGARNMALGADIMYGVGGAAAVTGIVLVVLGYTKGGKGKVDQAMVVPSVGKHHAGASLTYRF